MISEADRSWKKPVAVFTEQVQRIVLVDAVRPKASPANLTTPMALGLIKSFETVETEMSSIQE